MIQQLLQNKLITFTVYRRSVAKTVLSEHTTFIQKIEKFSGEGAQPSPQTSLPAGGYPHSPHSPLGAYGAAILAPSALNPRPPFLTLKYVCHWYQ